MPLAEKPQLPRSFREDPENPQIIGIILIDEPVGVYYGGTIAAPVMSEIYDMVLPYLFPEDRAVETETDEEMS